VVFKPSGMVCVLMQVLRADAMVLAINHPPVGLSTIKDYENAKRTPIANNLDAMQKALEKAGIKFTANSVSGPINKK